MAAKEQETELKNLMTIRKMYTDRIKKQKEINNEMKQISYNQWKLGDAQQKISDAKQKSLTVKSKLLEDA